MASLADLVTRVWRASQPSCVTSYNSWQHCHVSRVRGEAGDAGETDLDVPRCLWWWCTGCNIIIQIMSRSCVNRSQWTLWWILPPLIFSLAAAQTTTDPKTKYTDYTKNKMHYIYVIITYQRINCETEIFPSFSTNTESSFLFLSALSEGCWLPERQYSSFPQISLALGPSSCLTSNSIVSRLSGGNEMLQPW